ncbi:hypothetical protein FACS189449_13650 [Alphaproteobacteria bacterium]|nr:hypothetical protein FACS189449_13650 [Alphaproteobacteria bacterium]
MEVTKDYILKGRLSLLQPKYGYRVAVDPISKTFLMKKYKK